MTSIIIIILFLSLACYINEANSLCARDYCQTHIFNCPFIPAPCTPPTAILIPADSTCCRCCPICIVYKREFIN